MKLNLCFLGLCYLLTACTTQPKATPYMIQVEVEPVETAAGDNVDASDAASEAEAK